HSGVRYSAGGLLSIVMSASARDPSSPDSHPASQVRYCRSVTPASYFDGSPSAGSEPQPIELIASPRRIRPAQTPSGWNGNPHSRNPEMTDCSNASSATKP